MKKVAQVLGVLVAGAVMLAAIGGLVFAGVSAGKTPSAPVVAADEKVGDAPGSIPGGNYEPTTTEPVVSQDTPSSYVASHPGLVQLVCTSSAPGQGIDARVLYNMVSGYMLQQPPVGVASSDVGYFVQEAMMVAVDECM